MGGPNDPFHRASGRALARSLARFGALADCRAPDARDVASVQAAVPQLPARQRAILLAVRLHDRSLREIGAAWGLTQEQAEREFAAALVSVMRHVERQRRHGAGRR